MIRHAGTVAIIAAIMCLAATVPPLSEVQQARLAAAADGSESRDDAFAALVENARQWPAGGIDDQAALEPDVPLMLKTPAAHRGELSRVRGAIQQQTPLAPPWEDVSEWFVRQADGTPLIVYVTGAGGRGWANGASIEVDARFCKRMEVTARDGRRHAYAAFVGAFPRPFDSAGSAAAAQPVEYGRLRTIGIAVGVLMVVFVAGRAKARGGPRRNEPLARRAAKLATDEPGAVDADAALPDDPAAALAELSRRAQES